MIIKFLPYAPNHGHMVATFVIDHYDRINQRVVNIEQVIADPISHHLLLCCILTHKTTLPELVGLAWFDDIDDPKQPFRVMRGLLNPNHSAKFRTIWGELLPYLASTLPENIQELHVSRVDTDGRRFFEAQPFGTIYEIPNSVWDMDKQRLSTYWEYHAKLSDIRLSGNVHGKRQTPSGTKSPKKRAYPDSKYGIWQHVLRQKDRAVRFFKSV